MSPSIGDLRARLRATTSASHAGLEAALDLLAAPCDRSRFVRLLQRFHGFHAAWEPALARALPGDAALLVPRRKRALIDADLRALGAVPDGHDAPFAEALCRDAASALGSLYVFEGSTLGGKLISRHLADAADWLPPGGLRYFDPYGAATGARWKETIARLDVVPTGDWPAVEAGAEATFVHLRSWLAPDANAHHSTHEAASA